jgi:P27 family predicted phage terminase small subunit
MLEERAALTPGDYAMLSVYAAVYSRWIAAKKELDADGLMIMQTMLDSNGQRFEKRVKHPMLRIATDCERQILALASKLGLTPRDRDAVKPARDSVTREIVPGSLGAALLEMKVTR